MATAYELAFLSSYAYLSKKAKTRARVKYGSMGSPIVTAETEKQRVTQKDQSTRIFQIPIDAKQDFNPIFLDPSESRANKKSVWAIVHDIGLDSSLYCAKFRNLKTNEIVIAFRGSRFFESGSMVDWTNNVKHFAVRNSPYINKARSYLASILTSNAIITGHSLGGFIAVSMGYYFRNINIASFNAPELMSIGNTLYSKSVYMDNFKTNKIFCYNSTKDLASILTASLGTGTGRIPNVVYKDLKSAGFHDLEPMLKKLQKCGQSPIEWNSNSETL